MHIKELTLLTNDVVAVKEFYATVLGLPIRHYMERSISFTAGASVLTFELNSAENPYYHFAFNIPNNQLDEAMAWLRERAPLLPVDGGYIADFSNWNAKSVYFMDAVGNIVELIARYDLPNDTQAAFGPASLLSISEAGLVVDDVEAYCHRLIEAHGLEYFAKQAPQKNFAALGNDEGLLIVADESKNWYPTQIPAQKFRLEITLAEGNKSVTLVNNA